MSRTSFPEILKPHFNEPNNMTTYENCKLQAWNYQLKAKKISCFLLEGQLQGCWLRGRHKDRVIQIKDQQDWNHRELLLYGHTDENKLRKELQLHEHGLKFK